MPLTINVGLSRKTSENYNSTGTSINIVAELDQSLLARPDELQGAIDELYAEANVALDRQAGVSNDAGDNNRHDKSHRSRSQPRNSAGSTSNGNGRSKAGGMTASQRRAIDAIADRLNLNAADEARHEFGLELDRMTVKEASKLIDHLKALQDSTPNGARR